MDIEIAIDLPEFELAAVIDANSGSLCNAIYLHPNDSIPAISITSDSVTLNIPGVAA